MYQRQGKSAYKANLDNTWLLANYLNHPENGFKSIHVGGTNGKGSTSAILASVLQESGYRVGLYTSPHLKDFRERIKINGEMISKRSVSSFVTKHRTFFEQTQLSFFEMTVGLAFDYFRKEKVDIAVIEVGLGGRLDSTNIVTPEVSVITNIGLDHTQFLGTTLGEIATEKAGIIKNGVPVVIGEVHSETREVFLTTSERLEAPITFAEEENVILFPSDLAGSYQRKNQQTARVALQQLQLQGWDISEEHIKRGLCKVVSNTGLLGRWQQLQDCPKVICDTAHNKEGLLLAMAQLQIEVYDTLHVVLGVVSDKDLDAILPLFPKEARYYFCAPKIERALKATTLMDKASHYSLLGDLYSSVGEAYAAAKTNALKPDFIYVGGSTFVVGEII